MPGGGARRSSSIFVAKSYGGAHQMLQINGSVVFSRPVLNRAAIASCLGFFYKILDAMATATGRSTIQDISPSYFQVFGVSVGFLLVFKSNLAYARFWEARGATGGLCNATRSIFRRLLFGAEVRNEDADAEVNNIMRWLMAFYNIMMQDLRLENDLARLEELLTKEERDRLQPLKRRPLILLTWLELEIRNLYNKGLMTERTCIELEEQVDDMCSFYHGCTKIRSQPIPFSYQQLIAMLTHIYCFSVPLIFVKSFEWFVPVPTFVVAQAFFGINAVGSEIADPFGTDVNDINLEAFGAQLKEDLAIYKNQWSKLPPVNKVHQGEDGGSMPAALRMLLKKKNGAKGGQAGSLKAIAQKVADDLIV